MCEINSNLVRKHKHSFLVSRLINKLREYFNINISKADIIYDKNGNSYIKNNKKN